MREKPLWHDQMQIILGAGHGDVKQPTFLFKLGCCPGAEIRGHAAIDDIEQEHRLPFLALGRMDRRQDQIIFVEQGNPRLRSLVASGGSSVSSVRKRTTGRISARNLFELAGCRRGEIRNPSRIRSRCGSYHRRARSRSAGQFE